MVEPPASDQPTFIHSFSRLWEVVAYESLEHVESKFCVISIW